MTSIRLVHSVGVPIYKQIAAQLQYMIEAGQLADGDKLPSARVLAENLDINRHTVARAYTELREAGMVRSHRTGMIISGAEEVRGRANARREADDVLTQAIRRCLTLDLTVDEVLNLAVQIVAHLEATRLRVSFVECNPERSDYLAKELSGQLGIDIVAVVLPELDLDEHKTDLLLTTFPHLAEVRQLAKGRNVDVIAIVVAPEVQTLVQLAAVPRTSSVGIVYETDDQAQAMRDALVQIGLVNITQLQGGEPANEDVDLDAIDVVVVPTELSDLRLKFEGRRSEVIEFGTALDEASTRMVGSIIEEAAGLLRSH